MKLSEFSRCLLKLMAPVFIMFVVTALLGEATVKTVLQYNDSSVKKTAVDHFLFWVVALVGTGLWSFLWVWFKASEKNCIKHW